MKKLIHTLFAIVTISAITCNSAFAEAEAVPKKKGGEQWLQQQINDLDKVVTGLTDEQKTKLEEVFKARTAGLKAANEAKKGGASAEDVKAKRKELWKSHDANLKKVLTPEQYAKYKAQVKAKNAKAKAAK